MTDLERFTFGGIDLSLRATSWSDSRRQRLVVHEVLKRPGGRIENMERAPVRLKGALVFTGPSRVDNVRAFRALLDENPKRLLVHPLWGQVPAACFGWDAATVDYAKAAKGAAIEIPGVEFIEDQFDAQQQDPETPSVNAGAQAVDAAVQDLQAATTSYNVTTQAKVATLVADVVAFSDAAVAAASGTQDSSLPTLLANVAGSTGNLLEQILADPSVASDASRYEALATAEMVNAAALDLADAVIAAQPPAIEVVMAGDTVLAVFCSSRYGAELALARAEQIRALNPGLNPSRILAGTRLTIPAE